MTTRTDQSATSEAQLLLYGDIGNDEGWNDVTAKEFARDLAALGDVETINLHINSVGGDVFAGQAIYSMLKRHKAAVNVYVDGLAASIASVVAMAGDTVYMPSNTMMMVHHPWGCRVGNAAELRKAADDLDKIAETSIAVYMEKTGQPREKIVEIMDGETWLTAAECVELGFATEQTQAIDANASINDRTLQYGGQTFDLSQFKHLPKLPQAAAAIQPPKPKEEEENTMENDEITLESLQRDYPEVYAAVKKAGYDEGVKVERARMQALDALVAPGCEAIIQKARYETGAQAQEIALEVVAVLKQGAPSSALADMMADGQAASGINAAADPNVKATQEEERKTFAQKAAEAANRQRGGKR